MTASAPDVYAWKMTPRAERDAYAIPRAAADACLIHIAERIVLNPYRLTGPMFGKYEGCRSCHVGEYRVIIRVEDERRIVRVLRMEHRGRVYG